MTTAKQCGKRRYNNENKLGGNEANATNSYVINVERIAYVLESAEAAMWRNMTPAAEKP